ncbi:MAG: FeoA domain-containing protein [Bacillota bacterium]
MNNGVLPLSFLPGGQKATIKDIAGGPGMRRRLTELSFVRGVVVRVIRNDNWGPLIVSLGNGRLVIGRGMAHKIMVEVSDSE